MGRAFPLRPGCPVPSVSAITGMLVSSCKVDDPPEPIFQFPLFQQPIPNPPGFNYGCYAPSVTVTTHLNQVTPFATANISYPKATETGQCQPKFNFNIGFPAANCPDISASAKISFTNSPSVSLKVHKDSTNCSFQFALNIGIPNAGCVNVSTEVKSLGNDDLHNLDTFTTFEDVTLETSSDNGCKNFTLKFKSHDWTLDVGNNMLVAPNPPAAATCCGATPIKVVSDLVGFTTDPISGDITLAFNTVNIKTSGILGIGSGPSGGDAYVQCQSAGGGVEVLTELTVTDNSTAGCCGPGLLNLSFSTLYLKLPAALTSNDEPGQTYNCCDTVKFIDGTDGPTAIQILLGEDGCSYQLQYTVSNFKIPRVTVVSTLVQNTISLKDYGSTTFQVLKDIQSTDDTTCGSCSLNLQGLGLNVNTGGIDDTFPVVCSIACSSNMLTYGTRTLVFTGGILTDSGSCS